MSSRATDLTGQIYGKLTVLSRGKTVGSHIHWVCECSCGAIVEPRSQHLRSGVTRSCGCLQKEITSTRAKQHGMSKSPSFRTWDHMLQRCYNENNDKFHYYGGRGITVCDRWNPKAGGSFENFLEDMGERPEGTSLNRILGANVYSKETCEWVGKSIQSYDTKRREDNTSGKTGVRYDKRRQKFSAVIGVEGRTLFLGYFPCFETAVRARLEAELKYYKFYKQEASNGPQGYHSRDY